MTILRATRSSLQNAACWAGVTVACGGALLYGGTGTAEAGAIGLLAGGAATALRLRKPAATGGRWASLRRNSGVLELFGRKRPAFLLLGEPGTDANGFIDAGGLPFPGEREDVFSCHRGKATWLVTPFAREDGTENLWREFTGELAGSPVGGALSGVVIVLDAARLGAISPSVLRDEAMVLKNRLTVLGEHFSTLSTYLVVNNIDRLYGLRSVVGALPGEELDAPLGALRLDDGETPNRFVTRMLLLCRDRLVPDGADGAFRNARQRAAAFQAPDELDRLAGPLEVFAERVFGSAGKAVRLRGAFLVASDPGGASADAAFSVLETFRPLRETVPTAPSWFLRNLLRKTLPSDVKQASGTVRRLLFPQLRSAYAAGMAALIAVCLGLSAMLTWSYIEARDVILGAAGRTAMPTRPESLDDYRELAVQARLAARGWNVPLFGDRETAALADALEERYAVAYHDLVAVPTVDRIQDDALRAAASGDAKALGDAFLRLAVVREGIDRSLRRDRSATGETRLLHALARVTGVASGRDIELLDAYFEWAGDQDWMPETRDTLKEFERYLLASAPGGGLSWLLEWLDAAPGLADVSVVRAVADGDAFGSDGGGDIIVPALWTRDAYHIIEEFVSYLGDDSDIHQRRAWLDAYRLSALRKWQAAADALMTALDRGTDASANATATIATTRLADAVTGRDPAARFLELASYHLLPMDPGGIADFTWLRLYEKACAGAAASAEVIPSAATGIEKLAGEWRRYLGELEGVAATPNGAVDAVRDVLTSASPRQPSGTGGRALVLAGVQAERLTRALDEAAGASCWRAVSPVAFQKHIERVLAGRAVADLERIWYDTVFTPIAFTPEHERLDRAGDLIREFLTGPARGFWRRDGDRIGNVNGTLGCRFDDSFLAVCNAVLEEETMPRPDSAQLVLAVDAVHVNETARELPEGVEFIIRDGDVGHVLEYRNFPTGGIFTYDFPAVTGGEVRVHFRNFTARLVFDGEDGVADFVDMLSNAEATRLEAGLFDAEAQALLREANVREFVVVGGFTAPDGFVEQLRRSFPPIRSTIRATDGSRDMDGGKPVGGGEWVLVAENGSDRIIYP